MKKIRMNIFETNSSSTHSICVAKNINKLNLPKEIVFKEGCFGWAYEVLNSINEKASYLFTAILYNEDYDALKSVVNILKKNNINCIFEDHPTLLNKNGYLRKKEDIRLILEDGWIDHGDLLKDFINDVCYDENKLLNYLFSPLSFIVTGNDNEHSYEEDIKIKVNYEHYEYFKGN